MLFKVCMLMGALLSAYVAGNGNVAGQAELQDQETELQEQEAELQDREAELQDQEAGLREQKVELREPEAELQARPQGQESPQPCLDIEGQGGDAAELLLESGLNASGHWLAKVKLQHVATQPRGPGAQGQPVQLVVRRSTKLSGNGGGGGRSNTRVVTLQATLTGPSASSSFFSEVSASSQSHLPWADPTPGSSSHKPPHSSCPLGETCSTGAVPLPPPPPAPPAPASCPPCPLSPIPKSVTCPSPCPTCPSCPACPAPEKCPSPCASAPPCPACMASPTPAPITCPSPCPTCPLCPACPAPEKCPSPCPTCPSCPACPAPEKCPSPCASAPPCPACMVPPTPAPITCPSPCPTCPSCPACPATEKCPSPCASPPPCPACIAPRPPAPVTCPSPCPKCPVCLTCPSCAESRVPGYERHRGHGAFRLHLIPLKWFEAQATCEREGAHLAVINSQEEANILKRIITSQPISVSYVLMGFHDLLSEGTYYTVLDKPLRSSGYYKWATGEPNNDGNEDCGGMYVNVMGYNDHQCHAVTAPFICEKT